MRYALVSDVHGNLESLRAVLDHLPTARVDAVLCLGDVVGYGADPGACLDLIAGRARVTLSGNHEYAVTGLLDLAWFNPWARAAAEWTRSQLSADRLGWLAALPLREDVDGATLVHASPRHPSAWDYLVSPEDGWAVFAAFDTPLCFIGHTHLPGLWSIGPSGRHHSRGDVDVELRPDTRYVVNVGSVGQPRDGDARAAFVVWDTAERRVTVVRVPYDVTTARRKILDAGLPAFLGDRLRRGA